MKIKEIKAADGAGFTDEKARVYYKELEELTRGNAGLLNPHLILSAAAPAESPLHDYFEWDNREAAANWRLHQARNLVNHISVVFITDEGSEQEVRAFHSISVTVEDEAGEEEGRERNYYSIKTITKDEELRGLLLEKALAEFHSWRRRYQSLKELFEIFAVGEEVQKKLTFKP